MAVRATSRACPERAVRRVQGESRAPRRRSLSRASRAAGPSPRQSRPSPARAVASRPSNSRCHGPVDSYNTCSADGPIQLANFSNPPASFDEPRRLAGRVPVGGQTGLRDVHANRSGGMIVHAFLLLCLSCGPRCPCIRPVRCDFEKMRISGVSRGGHRWLGWGRGSQTVIRRCHEIEEIEEMVRQGGLNNRKRPL